LKVYIQLGVQVKTLSNNGKIQWVACFTIIYVIVVNTLTYKTSNYQPLPTGPERTFSYRKVAALAPRAERE
jgi:hypothetical protein